MDYVYFYNKNIVGYFPGEEAANITGCTIEHLIDNGFEKDLIQILLETGSGESYRPEDIPDALWNGSLLKKGCYYSHRELQITPPPPKIDSTGKEIPSEFFVEMKIKYTVNDLLEYFYNTLNVNEGFRDYKRNCRQLETLLNKYKGFNDIEPLDIILTAIDWSAQERNIYEPFGIDNTDLISRVYQKLYNNKMNGKGEIIWRRKPIFLRKSEEN